MQSMSILLMACRDNTRLNPCGRNGCETLRFMGMDRGMPEVMESLSPKHHYPNKLSRIKVGKFNGRHVHQI